MTNESSSRYQKFTQLEHILARPDTYVGSLENEIEKQWILNPEKTSMIQQRVTHVPGLFKIFDEILVNAIDQCSVDSTLDTIKVSIDSVNNVISVFNNGKGIPVEIHEKEQIYIPEMIFGNLLTSSNYNDSEKRTTGGRNGFGAKLANIFSTQFTIETYDINTQQHYLQSWTENMKNKTEPEIKKKKMAKGYAKFTFSPDLVRFKMDKLDEDIVSMFEKRVYDACACTPLTVNVYLNDQKLNFKSFEKYIDLFIGSKKETLRVYDSGQRWDVAIAHSNDGYKQVSFVNGIATTVGGSHVDHIVKQIIQKLTDKLTMKNANHNMKPNFIRDHLFVFVKATLENPSFSSQTKTECTSKVSSFGSRFEADEEFMKKVYKLGIMDDALALAKYKEMRDLTKTDGKKRTTLKNVPKLDDANKAGTNQSHKCTLILTEGDSAKAFAIAGLSIIGRDNYGVFPLRGKLLNVREATAKQLIDNAEINSMKQILGLQHDKVYATVNELRYGKIMILTDADVDGSHIKGLIVNFIHHFWPSLLQTDFITAMVTPVIKASRSNTVHSFYTLPDYNIWKEANGTSGWNIKYYKGLGTSTSSEAKEYFKDLNTNIIQYNYDPETKSSIELAFKKENADKRKTWILNGIEINETLDFNEKQVSYNTLINKDLIWFSISDVQRSIPSMMDGLKPSQRKVIYACRKRSNKEIKVSQLAGYVSTETAYHHGEQSMMGTIIQLAQDYVGSNNMNLLLPNGQFGTRLLGGKDAASPRYIFTRLSETAVSQFHHDDDPLLDYLDDDGQKIEPKYFVPKIPLVLVNGTEGIGTGYSTSVPCYNPEDIKENINRILDSKGQKPMMPWYKNFKGKIVDNGSGSYTTYGVYNLERRFLTVTELPIGRWTQDFKEHLDKMIDNNIETFENHSSDNVVRFRIELKPEYSKKLQEATIIKDFKLSTNLSIRNMHLFDSNNNIAKYNNPQDIISEFVQVRLEYYAKRKKNLMSNYQHSMDVLSNKIRFVRKISDEEIVIFKKKKDEIIALLKSHKFVQYDKSYDYLLNMKIYTFTYELIEEMKTKQDKLNGAIEILKSTTPSGMWKQELNSK
tara:strand:+ start:1004 stop:4255 length:3252 start_codon:yes stop_codon:yes gene_type:complete